MARTKIHFTNTYCLICLDPIPFPLSSFKSGLESDPEDFALLSLRRLSNYFKIDTSKLFNENEDVPVKLGNSKVTRVQVGLCVECSSLNETFSSLCQKLEKIEMEMLSCVDHVHQKLITGNKSNAKNDLTDARDREKKKILHQQEQQRGAAYRSELLQKYSGTITKAMPQVKIQRLTNSQVDKKKLSLRILARSTHSESDDPENDNSTVPEIEGIQLESEQDFNQTSSQDEDDMVNYPIHDNVYPSQNDPGELHQQTPEKSQEVPEAISKHQSRKAKKNKRKQKKIDVPEHGDKAKPKPNHVRGGKQTKMSHFNQETGRYECRFQLCHKGFTTSAACNRHYESEHLKIKHICPQCKELFSQRNSYLRHYRDVHANLKRFRCSIYCEYISTRRHNLMKHVEMIHSGNRFPCKFCSKSFTSAVYRTKHIRKWCKLRNSEVNGREH